MYRKELNERSPLRVFEQSIHGGLGRGNIGVAVGRHGVGKTAFLVGVALDDLMRGRKVLHVALDQSVEKVRQYYDEIFMDLARTSELEDAGRESVRDGSPPCRGRLRGPSCRSPGNPRTPFPRTCPNGNPARPRYARPRPRTRRSRRAGPPGPRPGPHPSL